MEINSELLIGLGGFIAAALAAISAFIVSKRSAKKDEVSLLREEIKRLQDRITGLTDDVDMWQKRYNALFNYVLGLRAILIANNLDIPELEGENLGGATGRDRPMTVAERHIIARMRGAVPPEKMPKPSDDAKG